MFDLNAEFDKRKPWITRYVIDGQRYGDGEFDASNDPRLDLFFSRFQNISDILELGSLEGGHTFALSSRPGVQRVVGIEGRADNYEKARFLQDVLKVANVEFIAANLEKFDISSLGTFDAVFCVGILYHLPAPWKLLRQIARVSSRLFIWTHYAEKGNTRVKGYDGLWYREQGMQDPLSGMSHRSFWPTLKALQKMLGDCGFDRTEIIQSNVSHPHGPEVLLAATQSGIPTRHTIRRQRVKRMFGL